MKLIDLNQELSILEVSGLESTSYLQGQFTNDIKLLANCPYQHAAHLNNKGRILANFIITQIDANTYHLITHKDIIEKVLPRLKIYVLRSKVLIQQLTLANLIYSDFKIENSKYCLEIASGSYLSLVESIPNIPSNDLCNLVSWHLFLINHGIFFINISSYEKLIPQQVNYAELGGISFTKGCYTGQEIVARMHYLGKAKQKMYQFTCNAPARVGQSVVSPQIDNQEVGIIVDIIEEDCSKYFGLVSLKTDYLGDAFIISNELQYKLSINELIYQDNNG